MNGAPQSGRAMRIALILSITLNLFLAGFLSAWELRRPEPPSSFIGIADQMGPLVRGALVRLLKSLPPEDARTIAAAIFRHRRELVQVQRDYVAAVVTVRAELQRQPLDLDKLKAAFEEARRRRQEIGPVLEEIFLEVAPKLSDKGRAVLSEARVTQ